MRAYTKEEMSLKKSAMITAALKRAERIGFGKLTRAEVADACGVSPGLVSQRFGTLTTMKRDVLRAAIKQESMSVLAYALAVDDPICKKITPELREKVSAHLAGN